MDEPVNRFQGEERAGMRTGKRWNAWMPRVYNNHGARRAPAPPLLRTGDDMIRRHGPVDRSRRDFIRTVVAAACAVSLRSDALASLTGEGRKRRFDYRYAIVPVSRLPLMKEDIERLVREGRVSDHEVYRKYIDGRDYELPEDFPEAKSIVSLATACPMAVVDFHYEGEKHELVIAPQYFDDGIAAEEIQEILREDVAGGEERRFERARGVLLKNLAVRSGLGRYGRNNIVYVGGMGTFVTLYGFYTDLDTGRDDWGELRMLDRCESCRVCRRRCPTGAIRDGEFVLDAGRCLTLYNETAGEFPDWIAPSAHNALVGCMACQSPCPENRSARGNVVRLEDVTEEETASVLAGEPDTALMETLKEKLRSYYPASSAKYFPIFTRNLSVLIPSGR